MHFRYLLLLAATTLLTAQDRPKFEAADIQRTGPGLNPYTLTSGGALRGERYDLRKTTMLDLIRIAYNVKPEMVYGGPNWLEFDRFNIAAKAPANSSPEAIRAMLQSLLADRFKLVVHNDTHPIPAYALTLGKGKPKLTPAAHDVPPICESPTRGAPVECRNMPMAAFAERLRTSADDYTRAPIFDLTGLNGSWDFDLKWDARSTVLPAGTERTTIFTAIDRQLGLSLVPRDMPQPVLVVDRVNETPTDNPPDTAQKLPPRVVEFEVADLKQSRPDEPGRGMHITPGGGFEAGAMDMRVLLATAWDVDWDHLERFANLPKWVESAKFDIHAKASTDTNAPPVMGYGYPDDEIRLMVRALLIDRFKIKFHVEDRPVNASSLVAAKPKMKRGDPRSRASCKDSRTIPNDPRDANPRLAELIECKNTTMAQFASWLQSISSDDFAYPVEDATNLTGTWDFTLSFTPRWMLNSSGPDPSGGISLAEALNKQLGLKLETRKRMLPVIVIDHMEEKPSEN